MANPLPAGFLNFPIVDVKTGRASLDFLRFLTQLLGQTANLNLDGSLDGGSKGQIATAVLAGQIANLDANGVVLPNGVDLSRAYVNKFLDYINDGTSYHRIPSLQNLTPDLPYNGDFEIYPTSTTTADGWDGAFETAGAGATWSRSASPFQGTYAMQAVNTSVNGSGAASRPFSVLAGQSYRFRVRAKSTVANPGTMYLRVLWYSNNDDLSRFSASLISNVDIVAAGGPTVANTW